MAQIAQEIGTLPAAETSSPHQQLLRSVLRAFEAEHLNGKPIHVALHDESTLSVTERLKLIKQYYASLSAATLPIEPWESALLKDKSASTKIYAIFGGNGLADSYMEDLRTLYDVYRPLLDDLIKEAAALLKSLAAQTTDSERVFSSGLDLISWLESAEKTPSMEYLLGVRISIPVLGLLQLATYQVTCKIFGIQPGDFRSKLSGIAGHSQGLVTATAVAMADSWDSWMDAVKSTLTILFYMGVRGQQAYPRETVSTPMLNDSIANGEGTPTPMLNVGGLSQEELQRNIDTVNRTAQPENKLTITLINAPRNFVVAGPPIRLYGLCRQFRKVKGGSKSSTGQVTSRYLSISAPYHGDYLLSAIPLILKDLEGIKINSDELKIPVYNTKTGRDLRDELPGLDVVPEICRLILVGLLDWPKTSEFPEATHIVDFGPGGTHGIGALTNANKRASDGSSSVRVILADTMVGKSTKIGYQHELFQRE